MLGYGDDGERGGLGVARRYGFDPLGHRTVDVVNLEVREPKQPNKLIQLLEAALFLCNTERGPRFWLIGVNASGKVVLKIACDYRDEALKKRDRIASELETMDPQEFASRYGIDVADVRE